MNLNDWREPVTKAFSCEFKPGECSCDNGILFSAEAMMLGLIDENELIGIAHQYELTHGSGVFKRYPTVEALCSWDDHFGASVASPYLANEVWNYMEYNGWKLPNSNWIGRIPILKPAVKAGAGKKLNLWDQLKVAAVYSANVFEKKEETSGKIMLFFGRRVFQKNLITRVATSMWSKRMSQVYKSPAEMFAIYFPAKDGNAHPFVDAAPFKWEMS